MSDLRLNSSGDVELDVNDFVLTSDSEAIKQHIKQKLQTFLEEYFLDNRVGIPWFQQVFTKRPIAVIINAVIKKAIVSTPGVVSLTSFLLDLDQSTRELSVNFRVQTLDEDIDFSEVLP